MYRIDQSDNAASLPTPESPGPNPNGYFRTPVPGVTKGTVLHEDWANAVQEELCGAVEAAGITLDKASQSQLTKAIRDLGTPRGTAWGGNFTRTGNRTFTVSPGTFKSKDDVRRLSWTSAIAVDLDTVGAGGRVGSLPTSDWLHVFAMEKDSDGSIDVYAEADIGAANIPTGYSHPALVFSVLLDGSSNLVNMLHEENEFLWLDPPLDVNVSSPGTTANLAALSVPPGRRVTAHVDVYYQGVSGAQLYASSPDQNDEAPSLTAGPLFSLRGNSGGSGGDTPDGAQMMVRTNTSKQIRFRVTADLPVLMATIGWTEQRGGL